MRGLPQHLEKLKTLDGTGKRWHANEVIKGKKGDENVRANLRNVHDDLGSSDTPRVFTLVFVFRGDVGR